MAQERARRSIEFCLRRLRLQAHEARSLQYPGNHPGPTLWLDLIEGLLDTASEYVKDARASVDVNVSIARSRDAARLGTVAYTCMALMRGSALPHLSYPIVMPFQRWLDVLGFKNSAFFRAETTANYELLRLDDKDVRRIRDPSASLTKAINAITWPIFRITVPTQAFAILPHFSVVAHEVGHAIADRVAWDLSTFSAEENRLLSRIQALTGAPLAPPRFAELKDVFNRWFKELAADAFALLLTGPAIFFSLCDFFQLFGSGYGLSHTHPANDLRRSAMYPNLTDASSGLSFATVFEKHARVKFDEGVNSGIFIPTPTKADIFNDVQSAGADAVTAAIRSELHESMATLIPLIYAQATNHLRTVAPESIYTPAMYEVDLSTHLEPLLAAIPPIESMVGSKRLSIEFASILNIGWVTLLARFDEFRATGSSTDVGERMEVLHSLLEKAVELSEAKRLWEATA